MRARPLASTGATSPGRRHQAGRRTALVAAVLLLLDVLLAATSSVADYAPRPQQATWVPNAPVYAVAVRGDHVYLGGSFTSLRDARTGETVGRQRLARVSLSTGELDRGWSASANDTVRSMAVSGDGAMVFVGGNFTTINGQGRSRLAALTTASGGLVAGWNASANNIVRAVTVHQGLVYIGGFFTSVSGVSRPRVAAVAEANGALSGFDPRADGPVWAIAPSVDGTSILVGGRFTTLRGVARTYLGSVHPTTGVVTAWAPPPACTSTSQPCFVLDLAPKDGSVYAAVAGPGGRVTAFSSSTGGILWHARGDGDVQSVAVDDRLVYVGGHYGPGFGGGTRYNLAAVEQTTGALDPDFAPVVSTLYPGVWDLVTTPSHLVAGGGFTNIGGTAQSRIALLPVLGDNTQTVVPRGSVWRYATTAQTSGWAQQSFDDTAWPSGATQIGYGDGDEATVVPRVFTVYARHNFVVTSATDVTRASLRLLRDDGAIVYLNGTEVVRSNMPSGTITPTTPASTTVATTAESTYYAFTLDPGLLREGTNVLAVEVHQESVSSSDVSLDAELVLTR
jgi:hypothetical protein